LSDQTNRIVITVGVAYGSDTEKALELLTGIALKHPRIMADPPPIASFESFGRSTLDLMLRCFLPDLENRLATITELHREIDRQFKLAGIEIAYPQQDIHVRSIQSLLHLRNESNDFELRSE
jgi:potassium efflux system protein